MLPKTAILDLSIIDIDTCSICEQQKNLPTIIGREGKHVHMNAT